MTANFGEKPFKFNFNTSLQFPNPSNVGRGIAVITFLRLHSSLNELREGLEEEDNKTASFSDDDSGN